MNGYENNIRRAGCLETCPSGSGSARQKPVPATAQGAVVRLHQDNPRAANQVVMGLIFVIAASTVASLISF